MIDAHHHLWKLSRGDYGWIGERRDPAVAPIERDFLLKLITADTLAEAANKAVAACQGSPRVAA